MDGKHEEISLETRSSGTTVPPALDPPPGRQPRSNRRTNHNARAAFFDKPSVPATNVDMTTPLTHNQHAHVDSDADADADTSAMLDGNAHPDREPPVAARTSHSRSLSRDQAYGAISPSPGPETQACLHANANINVAVSLSASTIITDGDAGCGLADPTASPTRSLEEDESCGWGLFRPEWCQKFRDPKVVLFFLCCAGAIQGIVINGFISVVISTIEKRFDLASKETGFIASSYDIASVLCLIPVSYYGGVGHKPRWLGTGILLLGLGSFMFALPHFTTGLYNYESHTKHDLCIGPNVTRVDSPVCDTTKSGLTHLRNYKYIFIIAQLLHGMGATPLYTLGVTYLDENLKPKVAPVYLGVFYSMAIIGPSIGYVLGGEMLQVFCDVDKVVSSLVKMTPGDESWVGAWWIGFLVIGLVAIIMSIPIMGFPRSLPGSASLRAQRVSEVYKGSDAAANANPTFGLSFKDIPASLRILLSNPTFLFLSCAGACEGLLVSGFIVFTPKFIEAQFSLSAGWAAQIVGFATIPAGGGGTFIGGYLVKRFDLKCRGIIKLCLLTTMLTLILMLVFLVRCPNVSLAGVNISYSSPNNRSIDDTNLTSTCNWRCRCDGTTYDPVCGVDGLMYFSPCHAGCKNTSMAKHGDKKVYYDCSCIQEDLGLNAFDEYPRTATHRPGHTLDGLGGKCPSDCTLLAVFLPLFALIILITLTGSMPALTATLRCVAEKQRSFALGIQWIIVRCLGTIPAPILFGALIDKTCQLWEKTACDERGSCYFYDNSTMSNYLLFLALLCKGLSFMFFLLALMLYKPPQGVSKAETYPALPGKTNSVNSTMHFLSKDQMSLQDVKLSPLETRRSANENGERISVGSLTPKPPSR